MRFALVVQGAPFSGASFSAYHFANAVITTGHELYRVFFYQDGVYSGNALSVPPQDEWDIQLKWEQLHLRHDVELIVCIASSLRRGLLDSTEAERY
ncbi:MAG: sulfurtransferase complex subunit TusD, partial [Pseudomonadales bacterium]